MSTLQDISSADSLIPNGNFVQGVAYWKPDVDATGQVLEHIQFNANHENDPSLKRGEPKYGMRATSHVNCRLNRNDLFTYPILRYLPNVTAIPVKKNAILIPQLQDGDFWVEDVDWATAYTAVMDTTGLLRIIIDRDTVIRRGSVLVWIRPDGTPMEIVIQSEDRTDRGVDFRSFQVVRKDSNPITASDTGSTTEEPFGTSIVHFVVRARPEKGSTVTLWAQDETYSGHYVISRVTDDEIIAVPEDQTLALLAEDGDVGGLVYTRGQESDTTYILRVIDGTLDVSPGDYFVATAPNWVYGRVMSVVVDSGVQSISISAEGQPPPVTGPTTSRAITTWAFAPAVPGDVEIPITGCRYELTISFTAKAWGGGFAPAGWWIDLQFLTEEGVSQGLAEVIDSMRFLLIRSFPVSDGSPYTRFIYRLRADRPLPIPGIPRIRLTKPQGAITIEVSHFLMYRGDFTGRAHIGEPTPTGEFEQLDFTAAPDGGLTPKGVIVAYTGGTTCPPGYREVVGYPGDSVSPSNVLYETDDFKFDEVSYDITRDVTTLLFSNAQIPLSVSSQDEFSSFPWSSSRVLTEIVKRDPPAPPRYRLRIKIDRIRITLIDKTLPAPPAREPRFEFVNIGLLKPALVPGMFLQVVRDPASGGFYGNQREMPDETFNCLIVGVRVAPEFLAYEEGSSADPTNNPKQSYPSSYQNLATDLGFWSIVPSPFGILTAISTLRDLYRNIRRAALYDPRRTGEPLPPVQAFPVEGGDTLTYIDLQGDWRRAFDLHGTKKMRIIKTGYLKMDADEPGFSEVGADEHNHRVEPSDGLTVIQPSNSYVPNHDLDPNLPPVLAGHGHNYVGAGAYSRPRARVVKLCVKE
jgi:hypothetical protein